MERRTYEVDSIRCGGCQRTIDQTLGDLDGVSDVASDVEANTVEVSFDAERTSDGDVREALATAGFPVVDEHGPSRGSGSGLSRYLLLVAAVTTVAVAGYAGYVLYPRFDLPAVEGAAGLGLAATAGVAAFFSPCSFPLLLGLLGRHATARTRAGEQTTRPMVFGGALAAGAGAFLLLAGLVIAAGGGVLFEQVTFDSPAGIAIRAGVGLLLVALGLIQVGVIPSPFHAVEGVARPLLRRQARLRRERPVAGHAMFGFAYVLAGFG